MNNYRPVQDIQVEYCSKCSSLVEVAFVEATEASVELSSEPPLPHSLSKMTLYQLDL